MRKVRYGVFVDFMPPAYEPDDMIGAHIYVRNAERAALRTAGYEYYMIKNGEYVTIEDASIPEKVSARIHHFFTKRKKKILGVRSSMKDKINPYSDPCPQLGIRLGKNGKKEVDTGYYEAARKRGIECGSREMVEEAREKERLAEAYVESLARETPEEEHGVVYTKK